MARNCCVLKMYLAFDREIGFQFDFDIMGKSDLKLRLEFKFKVKLELQYNFRPDLSERLQIKIEH